ncbi:hypothetical protein ACQ4LE_001985, partial [Meloidogyne hapla]
MLLYSSNKNNYLLKLLFLFVSFYWVNYAKVLKKDSRLDSIVNIYKDLDNGKTTAGKLLEKKKEQKKRKADNLDLNPNKSKKSKKNSKKYKNVVTKNIISKELPKQNKKQEKEKKEFKKIVEKELKKIKKEIEKEINENEKEEKKKKSKKHHKNKKEIKHFEENDDDDELIIPTFGEHPGFMPIVMHKLIEPTIESTEYISKYNKNQKIVKNQKDVHNLLWTAVAVAQKELIEEEDKGKQTCLLEFIARMVGGAYSPFAFIKEDTHHHHHITSFIYKLRKNDIAFLSSGYRKFWREKIGEENF